MKILPNNKVIYIKIYNYYKLVYQGRGEWKMYNIFNQSSYKNLIDQNRLDKCINDSTYEIITKQEYDENIAQR